MQEVRSQRARERHIVLRPTGPTKLPALRLISSGFNSAMAGAAFGARERPLLVAPVGTQSDTPHWPSAFLLLRLPHNRFLANSRHFVLHR